jgi:phospholipase/carboxylesterase
VIHARNARDDRGGFSLYVPEYYDAETEWPLVVALHGGSGHGRDFLWSWLAAGRSAGALVLSPTSRDRTWSLQHPPADAANLAAMITHVADTWHVDASRVLLTGMSDGGTYALLTALFGGVDAVTHYAPIASSFHPRMLDAADSDRLRGLRIYLTHGALDWMFPVDMARSAHDALRAAGVAVQFDEVADLSHTYPREQNARLLAWLGGAS